MSEKRLGQQLLIWGLILIALLVILWGYKQSWWKKEGNLLKVNQEKIEQTKKDINKLMAEIGYWGYRINLANTKSEAIKGEAAYRFLNDKYEHLILAELPDLADGYYYEGWLVQPPTKISFSIGKLVKQADGRYLLYFSSETDYSDFYRLVVTKELNDGNIEPSTERILTGDFK